MFNSKRVMGFTGPSVFLPEIQVMIEEFFDSIPLYIGQNGDDLEFPLSQIDCLCLTGGNDIFPGTYGKPITYGDGLSKFDILRDKRELYLIDRCVELGKPILAICRGFQLVGIKYGFHLISNISGCGIVHSPGDIKIDLENGGFMHYLDILPNNDFNFPDDKLPCNSYHHQAIYVGGQNQWLESNGLNVIATADTDLIKKDNTRIAEVVEHKEHKIIGCQFHAEASWQYDCQASLSVLNRFKEMLG